METNTKNLNREPLVSQERLRQIVRHQRISDAAVHKALEENRRLGLANQDTTVLKQPVAPDPNLNTLKI